MPAAPYAAVYPTRLYSNAGEVAVGDVVRMDHYDRDGHLIASPDFSDSVVGAISAHPFPLVTLHRPRCAMLDGKPVLFCETYQVELQRLTSRFHVCTTGWDGHKSTSLDTAETGRFLVEHSHNPMNESIGYRLCAGLHCEHITVGGIGVRCPQCTECGNPVSYFTIIIGWSDTPTQWHPTSRDFCPLSRGSFRSVSAAHDWAREHLGAQPYEVKRVTERGVETVDPEPVGAP
jgi:hypothetical protein